MFRVGVVGAGRLARTHIRHLQRVTETRVSVFDVVEERAKAFASDVNGTAIPTFEELVNVCDAVMIVTPNDCHAPYAIKAIKAGKHVFIEKPLDVSTSTAKPILDAAATAKGSILVGHVLRHFSVFKLAHEQIVNGGVGTPAAIRMTRGGRMPGGADSWFADHTKSGGAFIDLGVHDFDWLIWTLGKPSQVYAKSVGAATGHGADYGLATVTFENGTLAHVESNWMDENDPHVAFEVCGSDGMIEYDSRRANSMRSGAWGSQSFLPDDDPFYLQMRNFYGVCSGGETPNVSLLDAYAALELGEGAAKSARTGQPVFFR
jgi:predicted dehydrogenase